MFLEVLLWLRQKHLKICQEAAASCSQSRQMCEEIIGKLRQELNGRSTDQLGPQLVGDEAKITTCLASNMIKMVGS